MFKIGIDLGGTKIESILLDQKLNVVERTRIPTNQEKGYNSIIESIVKIVTDLKKKTNEKTTIGLSTPGAISKKTGLIKNSNTQCLIGKSLANDLEQALKQNIRMENDANCFTLAESKLGAAKNYNMVFGVIMGTGIGGGIVLNGKLLKGRTNIAGEWGHHTLKIGGNKCYCGKNGCVETYISGPALEKRWKELTGKTESLSSIVQNLTSDTAKQWKIEFLENFGTSLANVIDILDPDVIVLGGGVSNISFLYDEGKNSVYEKVFSDLIDTPILKNQLGDSAGVFGASLL
ncbi:MAG: ROK family protein [Nitrosopumilales archaeon]|nr:MAG: ROK family protein [Nitrosopumilales archaeon]